MLFPPSRVYSQSPTMKTPKSAAKTKAPPPKSAAAPAASAAPKSSPAAKPAKKSTPPAAAAKKPVKTPVKKPAAAAAAAKGKSPIAAAEPEPEPAPALVIEETPDVVEEAPEPEPPAEAEPEDADGAAAPAAEEEEGDELAEGEEPEEVEEEEEPAEMQDEISDMAKARKIKKEQEVFVGGLDRDATEEDLKKVFEKVGEVVEVRLHKDFATNKNKGFAFVKFASKAQAAKAVAELKSPMIRGKRCGVAPSEDNDTLFVGNICNSWTKEAIKRKMKDYGIDNVEGITLVADPRNEGLSRGFAFVEFSCHADAMLAYKRLQKPDAIFGHLERSAKVAFAEPLPELDPEILAQIKSVFIDGLPPYWDEDRVKEQFKSHGEIKNVTLARNMPTAKRKDFGFVDFTTHEAAIACIESVNSTDLGDGNKKTKARARLSNPLPKTQAVKGGMSGGFRIGHAGSGAYSRFGRGFARGGRHFPSRGVFQRGTGGLNLRGRGRGGRFSYPIENMERSYSEFRGRRIGFRGGRGFPSARGNGFSRGRGNTYQPRRQPFSPEEDYPVPYNARFVDEDPYYVEGGHGVKRPFSMMEQDSGYIEPVSSLRARYDHPDSIQGRYRGSLGSSSLYSHDYYGSDYGGGPYSSLYGDEQSARGYYY